MAKALGNLMIRGMVGVMSIVATAVITVLVQRYLYEKTGTPPLLPTTTLSSPRPASSEVGDQSPETDPSSPTGTTSSEAGFSTQPESVNQNLESQDLKSQDRGKTKIMQQFWDKLNQ